MPGSPQTASSFIPKRGATRRKQHSTAKRSIFLLTIISYSLLFGALLAAGATYLYKNYLTSQLQSSAAALNVAVTTFSTEDLSRVHEFDVTLRRATDRVDNAASVVAVLEQLDLTTILPVQLTSLEIARLGDQSYTVAGSVLTDSFDAALFQRAIYQGNRQTFTGVTVDSVEVVNSFAPPEAPNAGEIIQSVSFVASFAVPLSEVPFQPPLLVPPVEAEADPLPEEATDTDTATTSEPIV